MLVQEPSDPDVRTLGTFFRLIKIDVLDVDHHPDALDRLRRGDLHGVIVRNVLESEVLDRVVERLERHDPPFLKTWFPKPFRSWFFGRNLDLSHPDLRDYFREAAVFSEQLERLLPTSPGIVSYLATILSRLDRGRPFRAPAGPNSNDRYMFMTLRSHLEGGFIPPPF